MEVQVTLPGLHPAQSRVQSEAGTRNALGANRRYWHQPGMRTDALRRRRETLHLWHRPQLRSEVLHAGATETIVFLPSAAVPAVPRRAAELQPIARRRGMFA